MFSNTATKSPSAGTAQRIITTVRRVAGRKVWLPKLVYDSLPYFYLAAGFSAFFATLYISDWFWVVPHYLLFSAACLHLAVTVSRLRSKHRKVVNDKSTATESD